MNGLPRRVFVTGATGFIGRHLVEALLAAGCTVTALVRAPEQAALPATVRRVAGDLLSSHWLPALAGQDALVHLAADYTIGVRDRARMIATNVHGCARVLDAAIQAGVGRILHVSSTAAQGETGEAWADEQHRHNGRFRSLYEQTKHIGHELARLRIAAGAPVLIAVPGGVFGPGDESALADAVRAYLRGQLPIQIAGGGRFQLCPVARTVDGLMRVLARGRVGESYLLTGRSLSMAALFERLATSSGRPPPRPVAAARLRPLARVMDLARRVGLNPPLSREALQVMDGSSYLYRSDKAALELGWDAQGAIEGFDEAWRDWVASLELA